MPRCLIIDGTPIIRKIAGVILADFGFDVVEVATGAEALAELNRRVPELVLVDAHLSDMSALDVLRQIRAKSAGAAHVLYCTLEYDLLDLQRAHAAGATDVLVKPYDRSSLAAKLDGRKQADRDVAKPNFYSRLAARSELKRIA